jgi:hypothetical protein
MVMIFGLDQAIYYGSELGWEGMGVHAHVPYFELIQSKEHDNFVFL